MRDRAPGLVSGEEGGARPSGPWDAILRCTIQGYRVAGLSAWGEGPGVSETYGEPGCMGTSPVALAPRALRVGGCSGSRTSCPPTIRGVGRASAFRGRGCELNCGLC